MCISYNMDLVYINAHTKFYQNSSICSEDIEEKHIFTSIKGHDSVVYKRTRAGVYKTLCPQHLLVPKYGQICSVVIPQKILDFAQTFNR